MTSTEFANKLIDIAKNQKTIYVLGGYGQKMTAFYKRYFKMMYSRNRESETISNGIDQADSNTSGYDCNCLVKSTINGNKGYTTKPCADVNIQTMLTNCTDVSTDMDNIEIGEYLVYYDYSHCGVYVGIFDGHRMAVECTSRWDNGVQMIDIDREERKGMWKYHGKLSRYMDYPKANAEVDELKKYGDAFLNAKLGQQTAYIKAIQNVLVSKGYTYVSPVGYFGEDTQRAVKDLQSKAKIRVSGEIDTDTYYELIK